MNLDLEFKNPAQESFFWSKHRNNCFSGGFGNGKSFAGCFRAFVFLSLIPRYKMVIARQFYKDLKATTMQTFFKICPPEFIETHNNTDGYTRLKNGSEILWMHLDSFDEQSLRGLEINSALIDQAEECDEGIYLILDSRIGRWDKAEIPAGVVEDYEKIPGAKWPLHLGKAKVPNYLDLLCNPDTQFHWIYRRYHPESVDKDPDYFYVEGETDPSLNDPKTISEMMKRDPEWVAKYIKGQWGVSSAQIHIVPKDCYLEADDYLLAKILKKGGLYRILDHGDAAPTCCLWAAAVDGVFIFYREYYSANSLISSHRQGIADLSGEEEYASDYADPSIFRKAAQKDGAFWTLADEYKSSELSAPPLSWLPADNNEFATRNRINELLCANPKYTHPVTGESPAPGIYFIRKTLNYPYGLKHSISQLSAQRRMLLGTDNGKAIYSDDRDKSIPDHGYDPIRYFIGMHSTSPKGNGKRPPKRSFAYFNKLYSERRDSRVNVPMSAE